jgi:manganese-dependent inorganic pyrophosphatase
VRLDDKKEMIFEDMKKMKEEEGLHTMMVLLTDIMKEGSQIMVVSDDASKIESGLNIKLENNEAWLDGVLSRKKQIIPFIQPQF